MPLRHKTDHMNPIREKNLPENGGKLKTVPPPVRRFRIVLFQGYLIFATAAFLILTILAKATSYSSFDLAITQFIQRYHPSWFISLMVFITQIGNTLEAIIIIGLLSLAIYLLRFRWEAVVGIISATLTLLVDTTIKIFIHRPRPAADLVNVFQQLNDFSFPSGHVMLYTTFFGFMLFLIYTLLKKSLLRNLLLLFFSIPILLVGPSRVYLGEHWASDVLGAYFLGSLVLWAMIWIYRWGKPKFFVKKDGQPKA